MKRNTILAASAATAAILALGGLAVAQGMGGMHDMMKRHGMMGGPGMYMMERVDADGDGRITAEEAEAFRAEQLSTHDANGDGALSLDEFAAMHAANMRPMMVDRFQFLDEDGDGSVTEAEMATPMARMFRHMDRDGDGAIGFDEMRPRGGRGRHGGGRGMGGMGSGGGMAAEPDQPDTGN